MNIKTKTYNKKKRVYTTEDFIAKAREIHGDKFDYSKSVYTNNKSKLDITCKIHGDFSTTPNSHFYSAGGCGYCANNVRLDNESFIKRARNVHGDKYDYTKIDYVNTATKITIICPTHGEFEQTPNKHLQGGCKKCGDEARGKVQRSSTEEFIKKAKAVHGDLYDYSKVEYKTARKKIIIICKDHGEFEQTPDSHLNGRKCGYCTGKKVGTKNNLEYVFPELAKEWHPTKNKTKPSEHYSGETNKKHWWICNKGHEWKISISNRTGTKGTGCPFCAGQKVSKENNLEARFPEIAKQWHPSKNGDVKPSDVMAGTDKKYWWLCPNHHDYEATPDHRTGKEKTGCPHCTHQTSKPEMRLNSELQYVFKNVISRYKQENREIDIYLPDFKIGIEYDGMYFHDEASNKGKDINKNKFFRDKGIEIIRVREAPLEKLEEKDIIVDVYNFRKRNIDSLLKNLRPFVGDIEKEKIKTYIKKKGFVNEDLYKRYLSYAPSPLPENSLQALFPEVSKEWHPTLNFPLTPQNFTYGSSHRAWWRCSKGHEWHTAISKRTAKLRPTGCPYCSGNRHNQETFLEKSKLIHGDKYDYSKAIFKSVKEKVIIICSKHGEFEQSPNAHFSGNGCYRCGIENRKINSSKTSAKHS